MPRRDLASRLQLREDFAYIGFAEPPPDGEAATITNGSDFPGIVQAGEQGSDLFVCKGVPCCLAQSSPWSTVALVAAVDGSLYYVICGGRALEGDISHITHRD